MGWPLFKVKQAAKAFYAKRTAFDITCIVLFVLGANILLLTGIFNNSPLNVRSGVGYNGSGSVMPGQYTIDPNDGYTTQSLGVGAMKQLMAGHMPWWNHYEQVGAPLAGEMQSAALFPLTLLMLLPAGYLLFRITLQLIAGVGTYLLLRRLNCSRKACLVGGMAFSLNGTFAWLTNAAANPVAFLPWLLLGVEQAVDAAKRVKPLGFMLFVFALAISIYAGFPETAFINFLFVGIWALVRLLQLSAWQVRLAFARKLATGALLGLLLAAPLLVAFITYLPYANVGSHSGAAGTLTAVGLPALLFPYIFGPIFGYANYDATGHLASFWGSVGGYTSLLAVFLAIFGFRNKKHRALMIFITAWVCIAVAKTFGLPIVSQMVGVIPGISHTAFYRYVPPSIEFGVIIAMAFGLDYMFKVKARSISIKTFGLPLLATLALLLVSLPIAYWEVKHIQGGRHAKYWAMAGVLWGVGTIFFVTAWLSKIRFKASYIVSAVVLFEALLFFALPQLSNERHVVIDKGPVAYLQAHNAGHRFFTLGPLQPNYGTYWQIASINTNNLPISKDWTTFVNKSLDSNVSPIVFTGNNMLIANGTTPLQAFLQNIPAYEYVGVKYLVDATTPSDIDQLTNAGLKVVYTDEHYSVLELPHPQPYFSVTHGRCLASYQSRDVMEVNCTSPAKVVRRELYMPGWRAVDQSGKQLAITKDGPLFQSITVAPSTKQVTFYFAPPHIAVAYALFLFGVGLVVVVSVRHWRSIAKN